MLVVVRLRAIVKGPNRVDRGRRLFRLGDFRLRACPLHSANPFDIRRGTLPSDWRKPSGEIANYASESDSPKLGLVSSVASRSEGSKIWPQSRHSRYSSCSSLAIRMVRACLQGSAGMAQVSPMITLLSAQRSWPRAGPAIAANAPRRRHGIDAFRIQRCALNLSGQKCFLRRTFCRANGSQREHQRDQQQRRHVTQQVPAMLRNLQRLHRHNAAMHYARAHRKPDQTQVFQRASRRQQQKNAARRLHPQKHLKVH